MVLADGEKSRQLISSLSDVLKSIPNHLTASQNLNNDTEQANKYYTQSNNQCKTLLNNIVPFDCI